MKLWIAALVLTACGTTSAPVTGDADSVAEPPAYHPLPESSSDPGPAPCEKVEWVVLDGGVRLATPVPCRQYDTRRDLPRPVP